MSKKDVYREKLEAQLDEWQARIDELEAKAAQANAEVKIVYQERVSDLRAKQNAAREQLAELATASEHAWDNMTKNLGDFLSKVGQAVKDAVSRIAGRADDHPTTRS